MLCTVATMKTFNRRRKSNKRKREEESGTQFENSSGITVKEFDQKFLQQNLSGEQHNLSRRKEETKGRKKKVNESKEELADEDGAAFETNFGKYKKKTMIIQKRIVVIQ